MTSEGSEMKDVDDERKMKFDEGDDVVKDDDEKKKKKDDEEEVIKEDDEKNKMKDGKKPQKKKYRERVGQPHGSLADRARHMWYQTCLRKKQPCPNYIIKDPVTEYPNMTPTEIDLDCIWREVQESKGLSTQPGTTVTSSLANP